jgi:hypothetical protein
MAALTDSDRRNAERIASGWWPDDDVPRPPELSPLCSAQARRAWKQLTPGSSSQAQLN